LAKPPPPPLWRHVMQHLIGEGHHTNIVIVMVCGEGQPERRTHHVLHPRLSPDLRREQAPSVQHEQDLLAAFLFVLADHNLAAAGGGLPTRRLSNCRPSPRRRSGRSPASRRLAASAMDALSREAGSAG
jgi:hypothetical protein